MYSLIFLLSTISLILYNKIVTTNLSNYSRNRNCILIKKEFKFLLQNKIVLSKHGNVGFVCKIVYDNTFL